MKTFEDVRRSLIMKMDRLDQMVQKAEAPHRKNRRYYGMLEHEIKSSIDSYIKSIDHETLTVLEKLDIKEFNNSRKANGKRSMFARGQLQKKLMETLNWKGYDFKEIEPDYTSQCSGYAVIPIRQTETIRVSNANAADMKQMQIMLGH